MNFPTLYKKTSTGAIQFWEIFTNLAPNGAEIRTKYGQYGTDSPQYTVDLIAKGKNVGKKNETTAEQQADAEAQAKHEKQLKKGYVTTIEAAQSGELDALIEGGIEPMLAFTFEKQGKKIKYPCYVQGKLDGIRLLAIVKNGKCTLWSRTRKPVYSLPHIVAEIEKHFKADIVLDGEAYNHQFKNNFEHIVHLVRQEEPDDEHTDVEYHIYDMVSDETFKERFAHLKKCFTVGNPKFQYLKLVDTHIVEEEDRVADWFSEFTKQGYEGAMLRNAEGLYVNKRSADLIKVKEMKDEEFEILGVEEGRGKLAGHVGAFRCKTKDGLEFLAKMSGDTEKLRDYLKNPSLWEGKLLTVKFQDYTSYGVPRFPVGVAIRDYE